MSETTLAARRTQTPVSDPPPDRLPVSSKDVLNGSLRGKAREIEIQHGNGSLIRALEALGLAGPLEVVSPWELRDERGEQLIHAGGYAALPFGEAYPPLIEFAREYLENVRTMGFAQQSASEWRAALEANLIALLSTRAPSHKDSQVFFSNSGAEAIEAALKFVRAGRPNAKVVINFERAYHGKTFGALSLTPNEEYQGPFKPFPGITRTLPFGNIDALEEAVRQVGGDNIAGIFVEPIQGEAGVVTPPAGFLPGLGEIARRYGIIVVADEIQSGLGRTGHWFASLAAGLEPDIVTLAKPLSGGLLPIGATIARKQIVRKLLGGLESKRHSSTFGGGSFAAAVALKSLEIVNDERLVEKSARDGERVLAKLKELATRHGGLFEEVRGAGMLFAVQMRKMVPPRVMPAYGELISTLGGVLGLREFHRMGIHACFSLNASGVVRLTPALNMPSELLDDLVDRVDLVGRANPRPWRMATRLSPASLSKLMRLMNES